MARALRLARRPQRPPGLAVVARLHVERARLAAGRPVDHEAAVFVLGAEVEREPLRRRPGLAAPAGRRVAVDRVLGGMTRRGARCAHARRLAQREVLEAQVLEPDGAASTGRCGDRDLDRSELAQRSAAGRSPGERHFAAADAKRLPVRRELERIPVPPPHVAVARIDELQLELVGGRRAADAQRERPALRHGAREQAARDDEAAAALEVEVEPQRAAVRARLARERRAPRDPTRSALQSESSPKSVERLALHRPLSRARSGACWARRATARAPPPSRRAHRPSR